jgi:hypothetical protein
LESLLSFESALNQSCSVAEPEPMSTAAFLMKTATNPSGQAALVLIRPL